MKDKIQEDTLFNNSQSTTNDLGFIDNLEFSEPEIANNFDLGEERLFENVDGVNEEALFMNFDSVNEEVLYKDNGLGFGVEELNVNGDSNDNKEYYIAEEVLVFNEPTMPAPVSEEVLFRQESDEFEIKETNSLSILTENLYSLNEFSNVNFNNSEPEALVYIEKNFAQKLLEADDEILARYDELKNYMLSFDGVKSRVSNDFDSFNMGRTSLIKLGYSTKSLKLYLNLDFNSVEPRLKCKDVGHKKAYEQVPVFLRIKSPRAMKNAKYLIDKIAEKFALTKNSKAVSVNSIEILKEKAKTYN